MSGVTKRKSRRDKLLESALRRELTQNPNDALLMAKAMISLAKGGNINAFQAIRDTIDGKPHQSVDMDVDMTVDNVTTSSESELLQALRNRMAGILPKRTVSSVDGNRESGSGSDQKPH